MSWDGWWSVDLSNQKFSVKWIQAIASSINTWWYVTIFLIHPGLVYASWPNGAKQGQHEQLKRKIAEQFWLSMWGECCHVGNKVGGHAFWPPNPPQQPNRRPKPLVLVQSLRALTPGFVNKALLMPRLLGVGVERERWTKPAWTRRLTVTEALY